jgi:hypothetical protein
MPHPQIRVSPSSTISAGSPRPICQRGIGQLALCVRSLRIGDPDRPGAAARRGSPSEASMPYQQRHPGQAQPVRSSRSNRAAPPRPKIGPRRDRRSRHQHDRQRNGLSRQQHATGVPPSVSTTASILAESLSGSPDPSAKTRPWPVQGRAPRAQARLGPRGHPGAPHITTSEWRPPTRPRRS